MAYLRGCHLRAVSVPNWRLKRRELAWESYFRGKPASEREAQVGEWSRERLEKMDRKFCRAVEAAIKHLRGADDSGNPHHRVIA